MTHLITVGEHGRTPVPDEVATSVPDEVWRAAGCEVTKHVNDAWMLKAGSSVGASRTRTDVGDVTLQIRPKLVGADVFFMADYAYGQRHDPLILLDHDDVALQAVLQDPTACLLVWHARAIRRFAARWLRRGYQSNDRVLGGKVKGKILVGRYASKHLAVGDAASIPCRLQERTQDTANNRVLKAGLRHIAAASHSLPVPAARHAVLREANAALPLFAQVSEIRVSATDVRATSVRGPQRHYAAILAATLGLLRNHLMGQDLGASHPTSAFMWRMPVLFQEALRGLIDSAPDLQLVDHRPGTARIYDAAGQRRVSSKVDPDLVLRTAAGETLLLDTKYKDALPGGVTREAGNEDTTTVGERTRIKVGRADIYQAVAYRQHQDWAGATAGLLYPVVLAADEPLPQPMQVRGFGDPVLLMFVDIGPHARSNLPQFLATLRLDERYVMG